MKCKVWVSRQYYWKMINCIRNGYKYLEKGPGKADCRVERGSLVAKW